MERLSNISLHPVIFFSPANMGDGHFYPYEKGVGLSMEQKYQFWKSTLGKYGFHGLEPIQKGYEYVKISDMNEHSLRLLIEDRIRIQPCYEMDENGKKHAIAEEVEDSLPLSFEGGVVLMNGDKIIVTPQCCVSFEDYREWLEVKKAESFKRIWIGHPWLYYQWKEEDILLSGLIEKDFDEKWRYYEQTSENTMSSYESWIVKKAHDVQQIQAEYCIHQDVFKAAILKLEKDLADFKAVLKRIILDLGHENADAIADSLINGNGEFPSYDKSVEE